MTRPADTSADVIIVGAGLAGLVTAAELGDRGKSVILVEQEPDISWAVRRIGASVACS